MSFHVSNNAVVKESFIIWGKKKELESEVEGQLYTGQLDALYHGSNVCVFVGLWWLFSAFVFSAAVL